MNDSLETAFQIPGRGLKKLLVMSAFTAANHGLEEQYEIISEIFSLCIDDDEVLKTSQILGRALLDNSNLTTANYESFIATISDLSDGN